MTLRANRFLLEGRSFSLLSGGEPKAELSPGEAALPSHKEHPRTCLSKRTLTLVIISSPLQFFGAKLLSLSIVDAQFNHHWLKRGSCTATPHQRGSADGAARRAQ